MVAIKKQLTTIKRKWRIAYNILTGRCAIGIIIRRKDYLKFDYYQDLSLTEAMTMVVEMKRQINTLETHIEAAANIKGEAEVLEALKETLDITVGEPPKVLGE